MTVSSKRVRPELLLERVFSKETAFELRPELTELRAGRGPFLTEKVEFALVVGESMSSQKRKEGHCMEGGGLLEA